MAIYKKINRATGEESLRYILFDGNEDNLHNDIVNFHFVDCDLYDYDYSTHVKLFNGIMYVALVYNYPGENILDFCTHVRDGEALMPFYFEGFCEDGSDAEIKFDKSRTYTPADLETLYPSELYDTVEVVENGNI